MEISEATEELGMCINEIRMMQCNSGSKEEYDKYEKIIKYLNIAYDTLVLIGG
jgi:hypothetical protein